MTFRSIDRSRPIAPEPFCATPKNTVRLASHRTGRGSVLVIWIGSELARKAGLSEYRHTATVLIDDEGANGARIAIKPEAHGQFRAARRGQSYAVYIDSATTHRLIGDRYAYDIVNPNDVKVTAGMVSFPLLTRGRS